MLRFCCPIIKRSRREERYHAKDDETAKYSWEKEQSDPAQYRFVNLYGEIVAKLDGHIAGQQFVIEKCKECCILLLDHMATVNVDDCENCLIVLGPCKGSVFIRDCKNITAFAVCQQFRTRDCVNIDVFLFCTTKPIIESSRLMRFRSLALSYDKLEEHMLKASLSPFINNWSKVHDFTPEDVPNFEICPTEYDSIDSMDMVRNLEKVKFAPELSLLPQYVTSKDVTGKKMLVLCTERQEENLASFYGRILRFLREIIAQGAQLIASRDIVIRKGGLQSLFDSEKYAKLSGQLVILEIAWNREQLQQFVQTQRNAMKIVSDDDFDYQRAKFYRAAQMQTDI